MDGLQKPFNFGDIQPWMCTLPPLIPLIPPNQLWGAAMPPLLPTPPVPMLGLGQAAQSNPWAPAWNWQAPTETTTTHPPPISDQQRKSWWSDLPPGVPPQPQPQPKGGTNSQSQFMNEVPIQDPRLQASRPTMEQPKEQSKLVEDRQRVGSTFTPSQRKVQIVRPSVNVTDKTGPPTKSVDKAGSVPKRTDVNLMKKRNLNPRSFDRGIKCLLEIRENLGAICAEKRSQSELRHAYTKFDRTFYKFLTDYNPCESLVQLVLQLVICAQDAEYAKMIVHSLDLRMTYKTSGPPCLKMRGFWLLGEILRKEYDWYVDSILSELNLSSMFEGFFRSGLVRRAFQHELQAIYSFWKEYVPGDIMHEVIHLLRTHKQEYMMDYDRVYTSCEAFYNMTAASRRNAPRFPKWVISFSLPETYSRKGTNNSKLSEHSVLDPPRITTIGHSDSDDRKHTAHHSSTPTPRQSGLVSSRSTNIFSRSVHRSTSSMKNNATIIPAGKAVTALSTAKASISKITSASKARTPVVMTNTTRFAPTSKVPTVADDKLTVSRFKELLNKLLTIEDTEDVSRAISEVLFLILSHGNKEKIAEEMVRAMYSRAAGERSKNFAMRKTIRILWIVGYAFSAQYKSKTYALQRCLESRASKVFRFYLTKVARDSRDEMRVIFKFWQHVMPPEVISRIMELVTGSSTVNNRTYAWLVDADDIIDKPTPHAFYSGLYKKPIGHRSLGGLTSSPNVARSEYSSGNNINGVEISVVDVDTYSEIDSNSSGESIVLVDEHGRNQLKARQASTGSGVCYKETSKRLTNYDMLSSDNAYGIPSTSSNACTTHPSLESPTNQVVEEVAVVVKKPVKRKYQDEAVDQIFTEFHKLPTVNSNNSPPGVFGTLSQTKLSSVNAQAEKLSPISIVQKAPTVTLSSMSTNIYEYDPTPWSKRPHISKLELFRTKMQNDDAIKSLLWSANSACPTPPVPPYEKKVTYLKKDYTVHDLVGFLLDPDYTWEIVKTKDGGSQFRFDPK